MAPNWAESLASYDEVFQKTTQTEPSIEGADMTKDGEHEAGAGTHTNVDDKRHSARVQEAEGCMPVGVPLMYDLRDVDSG